MEIDEDAPLVQSFKDFDRSKNPARGKKQLQARPEEPAQLPPADEQSTPPEILVAEFDYSVDNHFKFTDKVAELCGYAGKLDCSEGEIKRLSDSITFLRHWRDFNYMPRIVRFAYQRDSVEKDVVGEVTLPQFSAAAVPQNEVRDASEVGAEHIKDFVMHVGGSVWALDWCPRVDRNLDNCIKSEFVAVAAHPPDSSYHEIGASLTGRGVVQIWCFLTIYVKDEPSQGKKKSRPNAKKKETVKSEELTVVRRPRGRPRVNNPKELTVVRRPRGRPRKIPLTVPLGEIDSHNQHVQPLAVEYSMGSPDLNSSEGTSQAASKPEDCVRIDRDADSAGHPDTLLLTGLTSGRNKRKVGEENHIPNNSLHILRHCQQGQSPLEDPLTLPSCSTDSMNPDADISSISSSANSIPIDVALPRMMLCLAHNGKVAWDVKWRPVTACSPESRNTLGYLAVLLGSGALEVWEVPLPQAVKLVYSPLQEHIDPRFIKLQPVFRCSMLKCGDRHSIPLTVEWSVSSPHDMILAGCHDGVVAIWKFSVSDTLTDSRPLAYISADTGPIRTLAWAPTQSKENANIIMTAGSKGFKFWDIRDPFRPLWAHPFQGTTYSIDWLRDPRCVFGSMEDGTMWLLSLERAAHDIPVAGKYHNVSSKHGFHNFNCSAFAIWSLQASQLTGTVAYCGEEGSTLCFQPTPRLLNDPSRNRVPHYLCGSILEEEPAVVIASPLPNSSFQTKSPDMKRTRPKEQEKRTKELSISRPTTGQETSSFSSENRREERGEEMEHLPPKIVAMQRVRWNVNKGGEKWLCHGGAAGLVRCQELDFSSFQ